MQGHSYIFQISIGIICRAVCSHFNLQFASKLQEGKKAEESDADVEARQRMVGSYILAELRARSPIAKKIWETINAKNFGLVMTSRPSIRATVRPYAAPQENLGV